MSGDTVLILGARSDMARAIARRFAKAGGTIRLAARDSEALQADSADLALRFGVATSVHTFDALDIAGLAAFAAALPELPDVVVCAVGAMEDQVRLQDDPVASAAVLRTNFEGPALVLGHFAGLFEARGRGVIVGISSVAGERGRASNYVYGAAKAGFTAFLSGLRNRLAGRGVQVVTVLPGFVATRMTEGMDLPRRLTAQPEEVAEAAYRAVRRRRDVVYVRPIWRLIMAVIRALPEWLFKRTKL